MIISIRENIALRRVRWYNKNVGYHTIPGVTKHRLGLVDLSAVPSLDISLMTSTNA